MTPDDAVTPQRQSKFKLILYILFYVLFYKIMTDYIFVNFDVKYSIVFGDDMNIHFVFVLTPKMKSNTVPCLLSSLA